MIQYMIYFFMLLLNFMFQQVKHPLTLGLLMLLQTFFICLFMGYISQSFWFSYILFLVFIGGMLILFIYVISLISNEKFNMFKMISSTNIFMMMIFIIMTMLILYFLLINNSLNKNDLLSIINFKSLMNENSLNLNKLYNFPTNLINLLLINYLFLMLIITVKITKFFHGPLRMKN